MVALEQWAEALGNDEHYARALFEATSQTWMAGQLFVREIEVKASRRSLKEANNPAPFLSIPYDEARAAFLARVSVTPDAFEAFEAAQRFESFTMSLESSEVIREHARQLLSRAFQPDGVGLREFIRQLQTDEVSIGISAGNHAYLETVFRTNTAAAYNAGRYVAQTDPDVVASTGFWQYLTVDDGRVRDQHRALHEKMWRIGDAQAQAVYPPNGFNCRCVMVTIDAEDVDQDLLDLDVGDVGELVAEGFDGPPIGAE